MYRLIGVLFLTAAITIAVEGAKCFRCEAGFVESKRCEDRSKKMADCFNEDRPFPWRTAFAEKPVMVVDIIAYDYDQSTNGRMVVKPRKIRPDFAEIRMGTWEDTHFIFMNVSYMACGLVEV